MDFTFKTNCNGLVLGCSGPVGLDTSGNRPVMRFLPVFFLLSDSEDDEARQLCLKMYMDWCEEKNIAITDGFFDCTCMRSAEAICGESIYLHRCLQHVKANVKLEAKRRDTASGESRLRNKELLPVIIDWIEFSAASLPTDLEFTVFWQSILGRMKASMAPTDFDEANMAAYLEDFFLVQIDLNKKKDEKTIQKSGTPEFDFLNLFLKRWNSGV